MTEPPDFSTTVSFGDTVFGFVAFRHETWLQAGQEGYWLPVPSWVFALGVAGLALVEWAIFKYILMAGWRALRQRWRGTGEAGST